MLVREKAAQRDVGVAKKKIPRRFGLSVMLVSAKDAKARKGIDCFFNPFSLRARHARRRMEP